MSAWEEPFIGRLVKLADPDDPDRATLAHLRRGIDRPIDLTLGRAGWLFAAVPGDDPDLDAAVLVAGLFAWVRGKCPHAAGGSVGAAFGAGLTTEQRQQREKRFVDLLDTDRTELPYKLRQVLTLLARDAGPLDWVQLLWDVRAWDHPGRPVQRRWARGFWAPSSAGPSAGAVAAEPAAPAVIE